MIVNCHMDAGTESSPLEKQPVFLTTEPYQVSYSTSHYIFLGVEMWPIHIHTPLPGPRADITN